MVIDSRRGGGRADRALRRGRSLLVALLLVAPLLGAVPSGVGAAQRPETPSDVRERTIHVGGAAIRALCTGSRPRVILLHDEGSTAESWRPVLELLDGRVAACAYDRRGSGGSDPAPEHRGWYELMDELRRIHGALGAGEGYVLGGHGLGGLYARLYAAGRPVDVGGLLLVDPMHEDMPRRARPGMPEDAWDDWMRRRRMPNGDGLVETRLAERARGSRLPELPVTVLTATRRRNGDGWDARFLNEAARQVHGSIVRGIPGGRHVPARGSGSAVHVDAPDLVASEILRLVEARFGAGRRTLALDSLLERIRRAVSAAEVYAP